MQEQIQSLRVPNPVGVTSFHCLEPHPVQLDQTIAGFHLLVRSSDRVPGSTCSCTHKERALSRHKGKNTRVLMCQFSLVECHHFTSDRDGPKGRCETCLAALGFHHTHTYTHTHTQYGFCGTFVYSKSWGWVGDLYRGESLEVSAITLTSRSPSGQTREMLL